MKKYIALSITLCALACIMTACASMASPTGGEYDFEPPKIVKTTPGLNATNVTDGKITIVFDENVTIEKPSENVIITPPQKAFPVIRTVNKKLTVQLKDSLIPDMTYTIDFTNAIVDNNEKNPLENFSYSFSTGNVVDSLSISGKVLAAENLEPVKGIYVGLHSNLNDTAFTKIKFERISRTNESGDFTIKGIAPGKYRIYALDDTNRDYMFDNRSEAIAFFETIIEPASERAMRMDTTFADGEKTKIDTVKNIEYTRFLPDDIVLRSFKSNVQRQYLQKYERVPNKLALYFGAPTEMPKLEPLNFDSKLDWCILEKSAKNDTLIYWLKEPSVSAIDTLSFRITYLKTDSLNKSMPVIDTLKFVDRTSARLKEMKEEKKKKKGDEQEEKPVYLEIKSNLTSSWDTRNNITLEFNEPITDAANFSKKLKLVQIKDTVQSAIPYQLAADSLNPRKYTISYRWGYDDEYQFRIDSAAVSSIYGLSNNKLEQKLKVKKQDQYAQLAFYVHGIDKTPAFIELLDKSDKPIRRSRVKDNVALFKDMNPGSYYARIILDDNANGIWDTGDYEKKLQPEMVCYSSTLFELKEFYELEHDWTVDTKNLIGQKPLEITKQKPQEKESRKKQLEAQDQKNKQNQKQNNNNNNSQNRVNSRISSSGNNTQYNNNNSNMQY